MPRMLGRMAILSDPTGAVFALWQAKNNIGAQLVNEANTFCWNELATKGHCSRNGVLL